MEWLVGALCVPATLRGSLFISLPFFFPSEETNACREIKWLVKISRPVHEPAFQRHTPFVLHSNFASEPVFQGSPL